ncbi:MAG TPA: DPP IV N-terminal domain-containing protein, partial [Bacteroidia bacterium]|nr:DPP IV N-terminal domain-containing protein [Bacteroidia bacterium]
SEKMVTNDGKKNFIINGALDWVYEEEFSFSQGYQWSNDGKYLAYYRFDESNVKEFTLTYYDSLYPKEEKYKYPKAGEENSVVDIYVYDLSSGRSVRMQTGDEKDQYIPRIKWTEKVGQLCVLRMNRHQNNLDYLLCNAVSGKTTLLMNENSNTFIEITDNLVFLNNGTQFIYSSDKSGYNQIYLRSLSDGSEKMLTNGGDVITFYGYDEKTKNCFYQVADPTPMERVVYSVDLNQKKKLLSPANGTASASFSSNFKYSVITHSTIDKPYICYVQDSRGKKIRVLENNERVVKNLESYTISKPEFFKFTNSENISLNAWMITPPGFKANENKKYPVIVYLYGGPGRQTVLNQWGGTNFLWHQMLAQNGFIVVSVDNRGTPGRGKEFANSIYKNMGHYETIDQIEFAKYLRTLSYVDSTRIGVHGWSYGGYLTSLLMTKGADYFKTGVAVAPVINWRYYDSIYTERYLSLPAENPKGYDDNSPVFFADKLKGKYLLIHGLTDDNVHFQNSAEMVIALVKNKKQFDTFYYPNQAHGISQSRGHLYEMMTEYFKKNL